MDPTHAQDVTALSQFDQEELSALQTMLGYTFTRPGLLATALTTPSNRLVLRKHEILSGNSRLECVGDGILAAAVRVHLYRCYPLHKVELIAVISAELTSNSMLSHAGSMFGLVPFISLPLHANEKYLCNEGTKRKVVAGAFEALAAALYLDGGMDAVDTFLQKALYPHLKSVMLKHARRFGIPSECPCAEAAE